MANLQFTFASQDYDHTRALFDGRVHAEGIELSHRDLFPAFTFQRMLGKQEFEITEMAMTLYFSTLDLEDPPFVAIPVFPVRTFRHSAIYVRRRIGARAQGPHRQEGRRILLLWP